MILRFIQQFSRHCSLAEALDRHQMRTRNVVVTAVFPTVRVLSHRGIRDVVSFKDRLFVLVVVNLSGMSKVAAAEV